MKITDIRPLTVYNKARGRNFNFVKIETDEGIYGWGESGITGKELAVNGCIEHWKPLLIGEDPLRIEHIWQRLHRGGFFKSGQIQMAAISSIDIALWDIKGKALGVPIWQLLGGMCRERVITYPHINGDTTQDLINDAHRAIEQGYKFVRFGAAHTIDGILEPRRSGSDTFDRTQSVREAIGDEIEICVDFHTRLDPHDAIRVANLLEPLDIFFIEDPARSENPDAYAHIRAHTNIPIAGGEELSTKWEFKPLIERNLIDYVRIDLCIAGGFSESRKIAGWAETHYQPIAPHNPLGPVSTAACVHLCIASPLVGVQELPSPPGDMPEVFSGEPEFKDGYLIAPTSPGLGIEVNEEAAAKHPFQMASNPELRRQDGSVTNW